MDISSIRKEYKKSVLNKKSAEKNPVNQFSFWLDEAIKSGLEYATAMSLVTHGSDGFPQSRIVLLKGFDNKGFTFFTNYKSAKAISIEKNNKVSLHFFWPELERQVRISGLVTKTDDEISDYYFNSRPLESRLSAVVSEQSKKIPSRKFLEDHYKKLQTELNGEAPKRPQNWGGYIVQPLRFEFWQGRENRLHDRLVYLPENSNWKIERLAP